MNLSLFLKYSLSSTMCRAAFYFWLKFLSKIEERDFPGKYEFLFFLIHKLLIFWTYHFFFISNEFIDFLESIWIFSFFFTFFKIPFLKKKINAITAQRSLNHPKNSCVCDMESWYKNISKIRNVALIFQIFRYIKMFKKLKKLKWILKNQ